MESIYNLGDESRAICEGCAKVVATTFVYRDVAFDDGSGVVRYILVAVCDACEAIIAVPAQSPPAIRQAR